MLAESCVNVNYNADLVLPISLSVTVKFHNDRNWAHNHFVISRESVVCAISGPHMVSVHIKPSVRAAARIDSAVPLEVLDDLGAQ